LKDNEHDWMNSEGRNADLVIVIGTSLGGLYADEVAELTASRARQGRSLGTVCINLQQTPMDGKMAIRMFGKSDDVLSNLLKELGDATPLPTAAATWLHVPDCVLVPYDANGNLLSSMRPPEVAGGGSDSDEDDSDDDSDDDDSDDDDSDDDSEDEEAAEEAAPTSQPQQWMWLDLRKGAAVKLHTNHNCQGADQPNTIHIGAKPGQKYRGKKLLRAPAAGTGAIVERSERTGQIKMRVSGANLNLGIWWLDAARRGALPTLPIINRVPAFAPAPIPAADDGGSAGSGLSTQASAPPKVVASKAF